MANEDVTEAAPAAQTNDDSPDGTGSTPEPGGDDARARRMKRLRLQTVQNMVLSLAIICAGTFLAYFLMSNDGGGQDPVRTVEYEVASATAARAAPYPVRVPVGLSEDWRATSVRFEPQGEHGVTWRLGFVNPDDEYVALAQADGTAEDFVRSVTQQAEDTGATERVDGRDWARWEGEKYDALVLSEADVTTVVMGTAPLDQLARMAGALEPRDAGA
ncbi:DUF4245 domain-containing protein [Streptomyces sp. NBRC 109706]|uniref:DUF4245 domain-containing protein n=1 Tax=Streptomyces sp. NBRC 109706 TaxID=1550035 RepID=UPI001F1F23C9|nr:DUF4245 domain-containing protein [Streptomyces sp. NBRC 109706]